MLQNFKGIFRKLNKIMALQPGDFLLRGLKVDLVFEKSKYFKEKNNVFPK